MSNLDRELSAYERLRSQIKSEYGSVWALVCHQRLVSTFDEFSEAARYAVHHCQGDTFVIKHTDERLESAPFVGITS